MDDKIFQVNLERSRVYWDYYKMMFIVFSFTLIAGIVATSIIYSKGEIEIVFAIGVIMLLFLFIILLAALMSISIWRHENRHLDEMIDIEEENMQIEDPQQPPSMPLV